MLAHTVEQRDDKCCLSFQLVFTANRQTVTFIGRVAVFTSQQVFRRIKQTAQALEAQGTAGFRLRPL